jgi:hypothetical protein
MIGTQSNIVENMGDTYRYPKAVFVDDAEGKLYVVACVGQARLIMLLRCQQTFNIMPLDIVTADFCGMETII